MSQKKLVWLSTSARIIVEDNFKKLFFVVFSACHENHWKIYHSSRYIETIIWRLILWLRDFWKKSNFSFVVYLAINYSIFLVVLLIHNQLQQGIFQTFFIRFVSLFTGFAWLVQYFCEYHYRLKILQFAVDRCSNKILCNVRSFHIYYRQTTNIKNHFF
jgi:hypothetical protein